MIKTPKSAWVKAMDFLARRDHSEQELIEKLRRHYTDEEITPALKEMKQRGWLLPPEELSAKVAENLHNKQKGYLYICHYLRKKGLPPVEKDPDRELEKAYQILEQKGPVEVSRQKMVSLLKNRGFDTETIGRVIHDLH